MLKFRGTLMPAPWCPAGVSFPLAGSIAEDRNAVVAAVRAVQELAGRMHLQLGRRVAGRRSGERGKRLRCSQLAGGRIVVEARHGRRHFIDDVRVTTVGMEGKMPWAGARSDARRRRIVRLERAGSRIEAVDHHFVEPQVGDEGEAIGGVEVDRMRVRFALPPRIDARTMMLNKARHAGSIGRLP